MSKFTLATLSVYLFLLYRQAFTTMLFYNRTRVRGILSYWKEGGSLLIIWLILIKTLNLILAYYSLSIIPLSIYGSLETPISILVTCILGFFFFKERFSLIAILAVLTIPIGIALLNGFDGRGVSPYMLALLCVNSLTLAIVGYMSKHVSNKLSSTDIQFVMSVGLVPIIFIMFFVTNEFSLSGLISTNWVDYVSIFALAFITSYSNIFQYDSMRVLGVPQTAVFSSLISVLLASSGVLFFGDTLAWSQWLGVVVLLLATILYNSNPKTLVKGKTDKSDQPTT